MGTNLVMTPQLQLAIKLLSMSHAAVRELVASEAARLGVMRMLGDHEEDPLDAADRADDAEEGREPWQLSRVALLEAPGGGAPEADVWVTGTPPRARANGSGPRYVVETAGTDAVREAAWLLRAVRQRARTFERVAQVIVSANEALFSGASDEPKTLTVRELAEAVGVHESTIERVVGAGMLQQASEVRAFRAFVRGR